MHQRLLNEATEAGAEWLLRRLPAEQRPALEPLVYQAVHEAVLRYADGLDKVAGRGPELPAPSCLAFPIPIA